MFRLNFLKISKIMWQSFTLVLKPEFKNSEKFETWNLASYRCRNWNIKILNNLSFLSRDQPSCQVINLPVTWSNFLSRDQPSCHVIDLLLNYFFSKNAYTIPVEALLTLPFCQSFLSNKAYHSINFGRPCLVLFSYCSLDCIFCVHFV